MQLLNLNFSYSEDTYLHSVRTAHIYIKLLVSQIFGDMLKNIIAIVI